MQQNRRLHRLEDFPQQESPEQSFKASPGTVDMNETFLIETPKKDGKTQPDEFRRRAFLTPHSTPGRNKSVPPSAGSSRGHQQSATDSAKRKNPPTPSKSTPEKIRRSSSQSGNFAKSLITQWVQQTGGDFTLSEFEEICESPLEEYEHQESDSQKLTLQCFRKKLQHALSTIAELHAWCDAELKVKDEIVAKINTIWESMEVINKFADYVSECLTEFQQQYGSLSTLYNDVIAVQRTAEQKLQQQLKNAKLKAEENAKSTVEMRKLLQIEEKRMEEMTIREERLKKQIEDAKDQLRVTENERDNLLNAKGELELKIHALQDQRRYINEINVKKDDIVKKLQEEVSEYKAQLDNVSREKDDLMKIYETEKNELVKKLDQTVEKLSKLEVNLNERQQIEGDLAKDLDKIEKKYNTQMQQYKGLLAHVTEVQKKLDDVQSRNVDLEKTISSLETANESNIQKLQQTVEQLQIEKENILSELSEKQANLKENENTLKSMKDANEKEISKSRNKISDLQETVSQQYAELTKLKDTLDQAHKDHENVEYEYCEMRKRNQELEEELNKLKKKEKSKTKPVAEMEFQDRSLKSSEDIFDSIINKNSELEIFRQSSKGSSKVECQLSAFKQFNNDAKQEKQSLSQPTEGSKKVRFSIQSPQKESNDEDEYSFPFQNHPDSQTQPDSSQTSRHSSKTESSDADPAFKFFKSRGTTKQYGNQRRSRKK